MSDLHPAHDVAIKCNELRRAVRSLYEAEPEEPNYFGLGLASNVLDQVADELDRHWWYTRRAEGL